MSEIKHPKCVDPNHGFRCNWATPKGEFCTRRTHAGRTPQLIARGEKAPICELFILRNPTYQKVKK